MISYYRGGGNNINNITGCTITVGTAFEVHDSNSNSSYSATPPASNSNSNSNK